MNKYLLLIIFYLLVSSVQGDQINVDADFKEVTKRYLHKTPFLVEFSNDRSPDGFVYFTFPDVWNDLYFESASIYKSFEMGKNFSVNFVPESKSGFRKFYVMYAKHGSEFEDMVIEVSYRKKNGRQSVFSLRPELYREQK